MKKNLELEKLSVYEGPNKSPGFLLWHISTSWRSRIEAVLKTLGLTHPQFVLLATTGWLTRNGELATQRAIGTMAGLDPNTTSQVINGLEKKGLIKRETSIDGRAKNPKLTDQGHTLLSQALPAVEQEDSKFFSALPPPKLEQLVGIFQKIMD